MVDKINQISSINRPRSIKRTVKDKSESSSQVDSSDSELSTVSLLENNSKASPELKILVEEKGIDFARRQLIREILLNKFGDNLQGSAEFELLFSKLNQRIESIAELKEQYNSYLRHL